MELFGIVLAVPAAFAASTAYCFFLSRVIAPTRPLARSMWIGSLGVLLLFAVEVTLLTTLGALRSQAVIGAGFYTGHLVVFFLGAPALANVILLRRSNRIRWY